MLHSIVTQIKFYYQLTKPGITRAQLLTVSIGYLMAMQSFKLSMVFLYLLLGTYCLSSSACVANSLMEVATDAKMNRTKNRPLPRLMVTSFEAILLIFCFGLLGLYFLFNINPLTGWTGVATFVIYVLIYSPLKRVSWINTPVGAIPGALPMLAGWMATGAPLHLSILSMFFTLFCWQIPHFYALSIMYLDDYRQAGLKMLPLYDGGMAATKRQIIFFTLLMIVASLYPFFIGFLGIVYFGGMVILSIIFLAMAGQSLKNLEANARKLFFLSILYLPVWLFLVCMDILII